MKRSAHAALHTRDDDFNALYGDARLNRYGFRTRREHVAYESLLLDLEREQQQARARRRKQQARDCAARKARNEGGGWDRARGEGEKDSGGKGVRGFFFNDTATTRIYALSLHGALPISTRVT